MQSMFRTRLPLLLFVASVLVTAAVISSTVGVGGKAEAESTEVAEDAGPSFEEWARQDPSPEEGKGRLLGHVERDGQLIEVREAVREDGAEPGNEPMVEPESEPEPQLAP